MSVVIFGTFVIIAGLSTLYLMFRADTKRYQAFLKDGAK